MVARCGSAAVTVYRGRFEGRTAVVTGAASGIGRDVARRLAAAGARDSMWDLNASVLTAAVAEAGAVHTQSVDIAEEDAVDAAMTPQHIDFMLSKIPLGRFGTVEEATSLVCWLASEECSFSTGAVFDLSGGRATY
jgi:NAD(P)-dependent dehydrogenase (short-subunit alcohol dehydrogenase family)